MSTVRFRLTGMTPGIMMHNPASMRAPGGDGRASRKKIPTPEEEAETGAYKLPSGQLYVSSDAIRECMVSGGKGYKIGKDFATSLLKSTVFAIEPFCPLVDPETGEAIHDYEIDTRRVVIQKASIMRSRPLVPQWATEVELEYDPDFVNPNNIEDALGVAGRRVGLWEYRPEKGGPFGRFTVEKVSNSD